MKKLLAVAAVVMCCAGMVFAGDTTPVKLSLFPPLEVPPQQTVHGLDLGLISTNVEEVQGVQLSFIYAGATKKMVGFQNALVDIGGDVTGIQWGFYNQADKMTGLQVGWINVAGTMKGLQLGLVNIIKSGSPLKFMVIANGNF